MPAAAETAKADPKPSKPTKLDKNGKKIEEDKNELVRNVKNYYLCFHLQVYLSMKDKC